MARLRTSLVSAIKSATKEFEKGNVSMETAAHKAALQYNEKENEILNKLLINQQKQERKGKVGRPRKLQVVSDKDTVTEKIELKNYSYIGPVLIKNNNQEFILDINFNTNTNVLEKAKDEILQYFFKNNMLCFISEKDFEKFLINK